jgi:hypothetical protein
MEGSFPLRPVTAHSSLLAVAKEVEWHCIFADGFIDGIVGAYCVHHCSLARFATASTATDRER